MVSVTDGYRGRGVYIASPILKGDCVGLQDMDITRYDSVFGVMNYVS